MADFPLAGELPYGAKVKAYIDAGDAAPSDIDAANIVSGTIADARLPARLLEASLDASYSSLKALDPRAYGAVGDGTTDDTTAIQACIDAAGANGAVELPPLAFKVTGTLTLPAGIEFRGSGTKESRLMVSTDICAIRASGGQGQAIRNFKVWNTFVGARTTYDIEFVSPTKPVIEDIEIDCSSSNTGVGGGVRLYKDAGVVGNSFMPQLSRVWGRYCVLRIDGVTDGKVTDSYFWAPNSSAPGAIQVVNSGSSWTFTDCDVVPPVGDFAGYYLDTVENIHIQGGLVDGSYDAIMTGWGIRVVNGYRISARTSFWNLGRGAIDLSGARSCAFVGNVISRCNKADNSYPDIRNTNGLACVFIGNTHSALVARTNLGKIYEESGTSSENVIDLNTRENGTNYYHATAVVFQQSTYLGLGNRPLSAWPRALSRAVAASETMPQEAIFRNQITYASGSGVTITLPSAGTFYSGTSTTVRNTGTSVVTLAAAGGQTIDGVGSALIQPGASLTIATSSSTAWQSVGDTTKNAQPINAQTGTSYTLVLADAGEFVTMTNAAASTLTVPPNSSVAFPIGSVISGAQLGAGQVTLTPGSGVTINASPGLKIAAQYGTFELRKTATDTWLAYGRLSA